MIPLEKGTINKILNRKRKFLYRKKYTFKYCVCTRVMKSTKNTFLAIDKCKKYIYEEPCTGLKAPYRT
jgi:hypothetical protein